MSELTRSLGTPYEFIFGDKVYKVNPINQNIKAKFEQRIYALALNGAKDMKKIMSSTEYMSFLQELNDRHTTGYFSWSNVKWLQTANGIITLACLLFETDEETINKMAKEKPEEMKTLFNKIIQDSAGVSDEQMEKLQKEAEERILAEESENE